MQAGEKEHKERKLRMGKKQNTERMKEESCKKGRIENKCW